MPRNRSDARGAGRRGLGPLLLLLGVWGATGARGRPSRPGPEHRRGHDPLPERHRPSRDGPGRRPGRSGSRPTAARSASRSGTAPGPGSPSSPAPVPVGTISPPFASTPRGGCGRGAPPAGSRSTIRFSAAGTGPLPGGLDRSEDPGGALRGPGDLRGHPERAHHQADPVPVGSLRSGSAFLRDPVLRGQRLRPDGGYGVGRHPGRAGPLQRRGLGRTGRPPRGIDRAGLPIPRRLRGGSVGSHRRAGAAAGRRANGRPPRSAERGRSGWSADSLYAIQGSAVYRWDAGASDWNDLGLPTGGAEVRDLRRIAGSYYLTTSDGLLIVPDGRGRGGAAAPPGPALTDPGGRPGRGRLGDGLGGDPAGRDRAHELRWNHLVAHRSRGRAHRPMDLEYPRRPRRQPLDRPLLLQRASDGLRHRSARVGKPEHGAGRGRRVRLRPGSVGPDLGGDRRVRGGGPREHGR